MTAQPQHRQRKETRAAQEPSIASGKDRIFGGLHRKSLIRSTTRTTISLAQLSFSDLLFHPKIVGAKTEKLLS